MHDLVDLGGELLVEPGDHLLDRVEHVVLDQAGVGQRLLDQRADRVLDLGRRPLAARLEALLQERREFVGFLIRSFGRGRLFLLKFGGHGRPSIAMSGGAGSTAVCDITRRRRPVVCPLPLWSAMASLAPLLQRLHQLGTGRGAPELLLGGDLAVHVALQVGELFARLEQGTQRRHLAGDRRPARNPPSSVKVSLTPICSPGFAAELVFDAERHGRLHALHVVVEIVHIDIGELAVGHRRLGDLRGVAGKIGHDAHDEGQLDLLIGLVWILVGDVDARRAIALDELLTAVGRISRFLLRKLSMTSRARRELLSNRFSGVGRRSLAKMSSTRAGRSGPSGSH